MRSARRLGISHRGSLAALALAACSPPGPGTVSPADLPRLEAEVAANPSDGLATLRLAAAQESAGDCTAALDTSRRGMELRPQDATGPLVVGACLEANGQADQAIAVYEAFTAEYANSVGAPAVAARAMLARRALAAERARELVASEASLGSEDGDGRTLAVMPLEVIGDEAYAPLSLGIASMITSDLALLQHLTLVERAQLDALLREIRIAEAGFVDAATAARAGRMLRAGTIAHGLTHVTPDEGLRLEMSLMDASSRIVGTESVTGRLRDLFSLEKELVLGLVERMGYPLSESERVAIMENGTRSLAAFLAYSRGLLEEDVGNYAAAAIEFSRAVREDPGFQLARSAYDASAAATAVQEAGPGGAGALATATVASPAGPTGVDAAGSALATGVLDVSPTLAEALGAGGGSAQASVTTTATPPPSTTSALTDVIALFNFRVILRLP